MNGVKYLRITNTGLACTCQLLKMFEARLSYIIICFIFSVICIGTVVHIVRPRESLVYTLKEAVYDRKVFDRDVYVNSIRRIIRHSLNQSSPTFKETNFTAEDIRKEITNPPCKGITRMQGLISKHPAELTMRDVERYNSDVSHGGVWKPHNCTAQHRVAIIIPYRDRYHHLVKLLATLVPILKQQNIYFKIYVTEQFGNHTFNKGVLMNAAFKEALMEEAWQCYVFHDVDMIPENVYNMYTCPWQPRHMSASVDEFNYE